MNAMEIHFNKAGNTIVGEYASYARLDAAITRKSVPAPVGYVVRGEPADINRLAEYVELFGYQISHGAAIGRGLTCWRKACELSGVTLEASR